MKLRAAFVCSACSLAAACLFPTVDGLTSGDASTDSGNVPDTSADAGGDAGSDAASCGDGSPLFCDKLCTTPTFCDDFDHDLSFGAWQGTATSQGGTVTYDSDAAASAPRSALCATPASTGLEQVYAGLQRDFGAASRVVLDFDVLVDQPTSSGATGLFQYTLHPSPPYDYASAAVDIAATFSMRQTTHLLDGGYTGNDTTFTDASVPYGAWHHIQLDMDFAAKTAKLAVDGQPVSTTALNSGFVPGSTASLSIGQFYTYAPTPAWNVRIDDVVVNATP